LRAAGIFSERRESNHAFVGTPVYRWGLRRRKVYLMLFLSAIARVIVPREPQYSDLSVQSRLGHVGLTVITLVYLLVSLWQR
jgi:hypothetical protein